MQHLYLQYTCSVNESGQDCIIMFATSVSPLLVKKCKFFGVLISAPESGNQNVDFLHG